MKKIQAGGGTLIQECVQRYYFTAAKPHGSKGLRKADAIWIN